MTLSLLYPWFFLGAAGLAIPFWLHLRREREKNIQPFAAVRFLDDQPRPRQSPRRLRDILLFLLRIAAFLLLLSGFAWPFLRNADPILLKESRVYIIDNTFSMQAEDRFQHARDSLSKELAGLDADIQAAVVELTSKPRLIAGFQTDRDEKARAVREMKPTFQRGSYLSAFNQAQTLLSESLGAQKRIIFLSDQQENQWSEHSNVPPFLENVTLDFPGFTTRELPNLSLSNPRVTRLFYGDKSLIQFTVQLDHSGECPSGTVILRVNGQIIFNRQIDLKNQPSKISLQAEWEADPQQWMEGEVMVEGKPDSLPGDNRAFFTLEPMKEGKLLLAAHSPYLRLALSPEIMKGRWTTRVLSPAEIEGEVSVLGQDVLCIESGYLQSPNARNLVQQFLSNGLGVVLFVDRSTPVIHGALRELGFEVSPHQESTSVPQNFHFIHAGHPIFQPFFSSDYGSLMDIRVLHHTRLQANQALPLIFSQDGDILFFQSITGRGKLFVSTFGMDRDQTNWPLNPTFLPFLDLCFQCARADDAAPTTFEPGEHFTHPIASGSHPASLSIARGEHILEQFVPSGNFVQIHAPLEPGIYQLLLDGNKDPVQKISVNPPPRESVLTFADGIHLTESWKLPARKDSPQAVQEGARLRLSEILQQRLWWYLLLACLATLILETIWTGLVRRV